MADAENESQSPFRQQALEYIATPKALDDFVQVPSPVAWTLALAIWLVIGGVIIWLLFGSIVTYIDGKGILLTENEALVYVSALEARGLRLGMPAHISPSGAKQWGYGRISANLTAIDNVPATPENILDVLKNPSLVNYFLQPGPVITLHLQLAHFTNSAGLSPGSLVDVRIITRRQSPLSLMLSRKNI